jgi:ribonucleotide reductase alpha subunit
MGYTSESSPLGMNVSKFVGGVLCPKGFFFDNVQLQKVIMHLAIQLHVEGNVSSCGKFLHCGDKKQESCMQLGQRLKKCSQNAIC